MLYSTHTEYSQKYNVYFENCQYYEECEDIKCRNVGEMS